MNVPAGGVTYLPKGRVDFGWISESWSLFKANAGTWIVVALIAGLPPFLLTLFVEFGFGIPTYPFSGAPPPDSPFGHPFLGQPPYPTLIGIYILLFIFLFLWQGYFGAAAMRMAVSVVRGRQIRVADLFTTGAGTFRMLGLIFLGGIASTIGSALCILPGFAVSGMLMAAPAMIGDGVGMFEAMSRSIDGIKRDWLNAAGFVFVGLLLMIVSEIPIYLGLLVTYPMAWIVCALAYRDMVGMPGLTMDYPNAYQQAQSGVWPPPPGAIPPPSTWQPQTDWSAAPPPAPPSWPPPAFDTPPAGGESAGPDGDIPPNGSKPA